MNKKIILEGALFFLGFFFLLILAGDNNTMTIGQFLLTKVMALAGLLLCVWISVKTRKQGYGANEEEGHRHDR